MDNRGDDMRVMAAERATAMRQQALATAAKRKHWDSCIYFDKKHLDGIY